MLPLLPCSVSSIDALTSLTSFAEIVHMFTEWRFHVGLKRKFSILNFGGKLSKNIRKLKTFTKIVEKTAICQECLHKRKKITKSKKCSNLKWDGKI